jgi:hypothetical protein
MQRRELPPRQAASLVNGLKVFPKEPAGEEAYWRLPFWMR